MKSRKFRSVESLLARKQNGENVSSSEIVACLHDLYLDIRNDFSVFAMILYHGYRADFHQTCGGSFKKRAPSFFESDYLEKHFAMDPSRYDIVLALAIKKIETGERVRAIQLLERVASSRYREHELADKYLATLLETSSDEG